MKRALLVLCAVLVGAAGYTVGRAADLAGPPPMAQITGAVEKAGPPVGPPNGDIVPTPELRSIAPIPTPPGDGSALARTVHIGIYAKNIGSAARTINEIVAANRGTFFDEQRSHGRYSAEVRVPADQAASAVQALRAVGVTEQLTNHADDRSGGLAISDADLHAAQAREQSLVGLIAQTTDPKAAAALEHQLADIRRTIELINAARRGTTYAVETVVLSVDVANTHATAPVTEPSMLARAWERAGAIFLTTVGGLLIIGAAALPTAALLLVVVIAARAWTRRRGNSPAAAETGAA